jgi:hypothetical protein
MKLRELLLYAITISFNLILSFLINYIIFKNDTSNFMFPACGVILLSIIIISIISAKLGYKLDIFAYDIKDYTYLTLNSIYIGNLFSIPFALFITLLF